MALSTLGGSVRAGEADSVHKMRVACRRLRSLLRTFRPYLDREQSEPVRSELRWLAGELAPARDTEVMAERLSGSLASVPSELVIGPVADHVEATFAAAAADARGRALAALDSDRSVALPGAVESLLAGVEVADADVHDRVHRTLRRVDRRLVRAADATEGDARTKALHTARKAGKRARYAAESVREVGGDAERLIDALKHLQDVLGTHHDSVNAQAAILDLASRARQEGKSDFTYGLLHAYEQATAAKALGGLPAAEQTFGRDDLRAWLIR